MKKLPLLVPLAIAVLVLIVAIQNASVVVTLRVLGFHQLSMPLTLLILAMLLLTGVGAGLPLLWWSSSAYRQHLLQNVQKQKAQLSVEASEGQVAMLERKVQTLEKALEKALNSHS